MSWPQWRLLQCSNLMLIESVPKEPLSFHVVPFDCPRLQYTFQVGTGRSRALINSLAASDKTTVSPQPTELHNVVKREKNSGSRCCQKLLRKHRHVTTIKNFKEKVNAYINVRFKFQCDFDKKDSIKTI